MQDKRNFNSLDLCKFIAAIFVVAIHSNPFDGVLEKVFIHAIAFMAVPFFFITSSFLFFRKAPNSEKMKHYLKRIMILYLFWGIYSIPLFYYYHTPPNGEPISITTFIHNFFLSSTYSGSWFLMASLESVLLVWLLAKKVNKYFILILAILIYTYNSFASEGLIANDNAFTNGLSFIKGDWMKAMLFISFGKIIADHEVFILNKIKTLSVIFFIVMVLLDFFNVFYLQNYHQGIFHLLSIAILPLTALSIFLFALCHETRADLPYRVFRRMSTMFYLSHFTLVNIVGFCLHDFFSIDAPLLRYGIVLALCFTLYFFMEKMKDVKGFTWLKYGF